MKNSGLSVFGAVGIINRHCYLFHTVGMDADVITGVDVAVTTMKKREVALISCDPLYAFGDVGRPEWGILHGASVHYEGHVTSFEQVCTV